MTQLSWSGRSTHSPLITMLLSTDQLNPRRGTTGNSGGAVNAGW